MTYKILSAKKERLMSRLMSRDFWKIKVLAPSGEELVFSCTPDEVGYNHYPTKVAASLLADLKRKISEDKLSPGRILKGEVFAL